MDQKRKIVAFLLILTALCLKQSISGVSALSEDHVNEEDPTSAFASCKNETTVSTSDAMNAKYMPFLKPILNTMSCFVCHLGVMNALAQAQLYMVAKGRTQLDQGEVQDIIANLCNPKYTEGAWLHKVSLKVEEENSTDVEDDDMEAQEEETQGYKKAKKMKLTMGEHLSYNTVCKRTCLTAADICESIIENTAFDDFTEAVAGLTLDMFGDNTVMEKFREKYCEHFSQCINIKTMRKSFNQLLNQPGSKWKREIEEDSVHYVQDPEEERKLFIRDAGMLSTFTAEDFHRLEEHTKMQMERHFKEQSNNSELDKDDEMDENESLSGQRPPQGFDSDTTDSEVLDDL